MTNSRGPFEKSEPEVAIIPDTRVHEDETLYDALSRMNLLWQPNASVFAHLVREGQIGLVSDNGKARFAAPGRHRLWSPWAAWKGLRQITDRNIQLNDIQIVTIDEGTTGLVKSKGQYTLLNPGQHVLKAPQQYVTAKAMDENYVRLGTHHWVTVPLGSVAVAFDQGRKIIITPQPLDVDDEHDQYIRMTDGERFYIESPTFKFDAATGYKSIQMEDIELPPLVVNTQEMIPLEILPSVRYKIIDPVKAFLLTEDVVGDIKKQAHATLTSVFHQISINELSATLASTGTHELKGKGKQQAEDDPGDMFHHATALFMEEFNKIVAQYGVKTQLININSMSFKDVEFRDTVKQRAQQNMQASTRLAVIEAENQVKLAAAEQSKREAVLAAEAKAESTRLEADARVYAASKDAEAAQMLAEQPLAAELAVMDGRAKIARELGDKTVITDASMSLGSYGIQGVKGQMLWMQGAKNKPSPSNASKMDLVKQDDSPSLTRSGQ